MQQLAKDPERYQLPKKMVKIQCNIRLEKVKKEQLKNIAKQQNRQYSDIIRDKIDEVINVGK